MNMQAFTRLNAATCFLGILLSFISTSLLGQTTITFDDQGYAHDAKLGKTVTIGNFEFSVRDENLQEHEAGSDIYYESDLDGNGFEGSGLIYVGDQFNTDDPFYFIIKTVDGTQRDFQSLYIFDYLVTSIEVNLTAEAYRDGALLGSQDLIIPASSKAAYTLDPVFDNVDEIRLRQQTPLKYPGYPGVLFAFDHFVIGSAGANAPPAVSGLPVSIEIVEDTEGPLDIASSTFSDEDSDEIKAILSVSEGTIALAAPGGRPVELSGNATSTITVTGTPDAVNGYIDFPSNIIYMPPANLYGNPAAILTVSADDGSGDVELGTVPINIAGVPDAPLITTSDGNTTFSSSGSDPAPVAIDNALKVEHPDGTSLVSATVSVSGNFQSAEDVLGFSNDGSTMGNIDAGYNASTGVLTLTSAAATATLAEWEAALRAVTYGNSSSRPNTITRTVSFVVNDGAANSTPATKDIDLEVVNSAPIAVNDEITTMENVPGTGNVLTNDSDPEGNQLTASLVTAPTLGTVVLNADGSFTYTPNADFVGLDSLTYQVCDNGNPSRCDTAFAFFRVENVDAAPEIMTVNASAPDGTYKLNDEIAITVTFDQPVDVAGGVPGLLLETGGTDRAAIYSSGSASNTLRFNYTVQAGDRTPDLDYTSTAALALNGATLRNDADMDAVVTLPATGGAGSIAGQHEIVIDGVVPVVNSADVPANGYYREGDTMGFTVQLSEPVIVNPAGGTPYLELTIGSATVRAAYASGSGTKALFFSHTVQAGEQDLDGITLGADIIRNGGTIRDAAGNNAIAALNNAAPTNNIFVYSVQPGVTLSATAGSLVNQPFTVNIAFTEAVTGFTLADMITANAGLSALNTTDNISYTALVTPAADGPVSIQVPADAARNIGNIGNAASDTLKRTYDATAPTVTSVAVPANQTYGRGDVLSFTVNYSENIRVNTGGGTPFLQLGIGSKLVEAQYTGGSGSKALTFDYAVQAGELDRDGIDLGTDITLNGGSIRDRAANDAAVALRGAGNTDSVLVDALAPVVRSVDVPADGYYREGDTLNFTVRTNEAVIVNPAGGRPYLELTIGSASVRALYESGSGTRALVFSHTVQAGEQDLDGIALGNSIVRNGGVIRDAAGNNAVTNLQNAAPTDGVFVYSARPGVRLSAEAASPVNQAFTVKIAFTEAVTGFDISDITAVNATLSNLQTADNITYTARVIPSADGRISLSIPAGAAKNIGSNENTASNTLNRVYDGTVPAVPQGLAAVPDDGRHLISWTENTDDDLAGYVLYGAATPDPDTVLARINAPANTYTHSGVEAGVRWYYRLAAIDESGNESRPSEEVTAVIKLKQEITFAAAAAATYGMADFDPGASSTNNSIEIEYSSSNEEVATIVAGMVHIKNAGTVTITASQKGNGLYNAAVPREQVLTIAKVPLTITAESKSRKFGEENPVFTFTYEGFVNGEDETVLSSAPSASTEATPLSDPGKYPIVAGGAAAANYTLRYVDGILTVSAASRTLTFATLPEKTYGDADFDPGAVADTREPVIYSSSNTAVAEIVDGEIRITGAGTTTITATLPENPQFNNTPEISRELVVNKATQEIQFAEIGQVPRDAGTLQLNVSATSGLPVQLEVSDNLVATLSGPLDLQVLRLGRTIITATQPGDANYLPAAPVERELLVADENGQRVRVHQVVSPNSDGINDFLILEGINEFPDNRLIVVNRNGVQLFDTRGYDNGSNVFHGKANTRVIGENLPAGTYFYLLEYRAGGEMQRLKGWFVLKYE